MPSVLKETKQLGWGGNRVCRCSTSKRWPGSSLVLGKGAALFCRSQEKEITKHLWERTSHFEAPGEEKETLTIAYPVPGDCRFLMDRDKRLARESFGDMWKEEGAVG